MASIITATNSNGLTQSADNSGVLQLATNNGTTALTIDTSQNVGIGTSSPTKLLSVRKTQNAETSILVQNESTGTAGKAIIRFGNSNGENVGSVGALSSGFTPSGELEADGFYVDSARQSLNLSSSNNGIIKFFGAGTERMRIDSSGSLLVNSTSSVGSNTRIQAYSASGNGAQGWIGCFTGGSGGGRANQNVGFLVGQTDLRIYADWDGSGNPRNKINVQAVSAGVELTSGATSWASLSDERKKDIIEPITDALNKVSSLRTVIGKYKNEEDRRRVFLIAQDVQAVLPEAVDESTDEEKTLGLRYTDVIPLLVASIRELNAKVDAQAVRIAELEGAK
jgi:hypothetical protein